MLSAKSQDVEVFMNGHAALSDGELIVKPPKTFTPLHLFVCMYPAVLNNLRMKFDGFVELCKRISLRGEDLPPSVIAFNSNFGHCARPGHENYIKHPKIQALPASGKPRKCQGDGTCFNNAIEPIIVLNEPDVLPGKVYKIKCFPTTGTTQIPGLVRPDLSDGHKALMVFVDFMNSLGVGVPDADGIPMQITIRSEGANMIDYKFRLIRSSPRMIINLQSLAEYVRRLEEARITAETKTEEPPGGEEPPSGKELPDTVGPLNYTGLSSDLTGLSSDLTGLSSDLTGLLSGLAGMSSNFTEIPDFGDIESATEPCLIPPPYLVRETCPPIDDIKMSFRFVCGERRPRVNVFQKGKIDILGVEYPHTAYAIYEYIVKIFEVNWEEFVCLKPRRDNEVLASKQPYKPRIDPKVEAARAEARAAAAVPAAVHIELMRTRLESITGLDELVSELDI